MNFHLSRPIQKYNTLYSLNTLNTKQSKKSMDAKIQQFITNLVDTFQLNEAQLKEMWITVDTPPTAEAPMDTAEVKSTKKAPFTCNHIFTKKSGNVCNVKVATANGFCSKHISVGQKKWEELVFAQIPDAAIEYYKAEKKNLMVAGEKPTRATANNVAAWVMILYKNGPTADSTDFELDMQFAFMTFTHPVFGLAHYFKNCTAPDESNVDEYKKYECVRVEFEHAKKIYASQYPGNSSLKEFGI